MPLTLKIIYNCHKYSLKYKRDHFPLVLWFLLYGSWTMFAGSVWGQSFHVLTTMGICVPGCLQLCPGPIQTGLVPLVWISSALIFPQSSDFSTTCFLAVYGWDFHEVQIGGGRPRAVPIPSLSRYGTPPLMGLGSLWSGHCQLWQTR